MNKAFTKCKSSGKKKKSSRVKVRSEKSKNRNFVGNDRKGDFEVKQYLKKKQSNGTNITMNNCNISIYTQFDSNKQVSALAKKTVPTSKRSKKVTGVLSIVSDLISVLSFLWNSVQPCFQGIKIILALF